jgi:hypothetical protein
MTKINSTLALFLIICLHSFSQNNKEIFSDEKNIKHQIGIGINKFVNSAFASDKNAYSINYRYKYNTKISLRSGAIYEKDNFYLINFNNYNNRRLYALSCNRTQYRRR